MRLLNALTHSLTEVAVSGCYFFLDFYLCLLFVSCSAYGIGEIRALITNPSSASRRFPGCLKFLRCTLFNILLYNLCILLTSNIYIYAARDCLSSKRVGMLPQFSVECFVGLNGLLLGYVVFYFFG